MRGTRRVLMALAATTLVAGLVAAVTTSTRRASATVDVNVLNYGANPNGTSDNTSAFAAAIAALEANDGGTLTVPAGTYAFTQPLQNDLSASVKVTGSYPVTIQGAGSGSTWLVQHVTGQGLLSVKVDGSSVRGVTLDARSYGGGPALTVRANDTVVDSDSIYGAQKQVPLGGGAQSPFALYYQGPPGATMNKPKYYQGNVVSNDYIEDGINNDGFSFSYQDNGTIENITHYGSRLAIFLDENVTVDNYNYTPNPECAGATNGYFITSPSSNITIDNFTSSGDGGIIAAPAGGYLTTNVTINDETMTGQGGVVKIGNVTGLTIDNSNFGTAGSSSPQSNYLLFFPGTAVPTPASGTLTTLVENSTLARVAFDGWYEPHKPQNVYTWWSDTNDPALDFENDTFTGYTSPSTGNPGATFVEEGPVGSGTVTMNGGSLSCAGPFYSPVVNKQDPQDVITFSVGATTPVSGYPCA